MDMLSITGLAVALTAIGVGQMLEGGHLLSLVNIPAFVIVIGGTLGAVLVQVPMVTFRRALRRTVWIIRPPTVSIRQTIDSIIEWDSVARKQGLLGLENLIEEEPNGFSAKALRLLVDGSEPQDIRAVLELDLNVREDIDYQAARLFEGMGGYAPTVGILGAVLGLIHVMENLSDPTKLGSGIATAFIATVYGVGFANLIFLPLANKLKSIVNRQSQIDEMIIEGIVAIAQGDSVLTLQAKLNSFAKHLA